MFNTQFIKYGFIGVFNTLVGYGIIFYFFYIGISPELANFVGYLIGFLLSYFLNKKFNFKSKSSHKSDLPRFFLSMLLAYLVNLIIFIITYRYFDLNIYFSQIIAGFVYMIVGYILSKKWVFKN